MTYPKKDEEVCFKIQSILEKLPQNVTELNEEIEYLNKHFDCSITIDK